MRSTRILLSLWLFLAGTSGALAGIVIDDAYLLAATPMARSGAIFLTITNTGPDADRLIEVETEFARVAELHTHIAGDDGVMMMRPVEGGIEIPAGVTHPLQRGGDHLMLMGLTQAVPDGLVVSVTLVFEHAGRIEIEVPVDRSR